MAGLTVILDACVLYPAPLRDFLMYLALTPLFRARWSATIHDEWIRNLLKNRPDITPARLERTRTQMNRAVPNCLVEGYESLIPSLALPDPDDRHVLAAAICSCASVIVTFNERDFPAAALAPFGIEAQHPDTFCAHLCSLDVATVCEAVREHRASLRNPPKTVEDFLATLEAHGLIQTVARLREFSTVL